MNTDLTKRALAGALLAMTGVLVGLAAGEATTAAHPDTVVAYGGFEFAPLEPVLKARRNMEVDQQDAQKKTNLSDAGTKVPPPPPPPPTPPPT